MNYFQVGNLVRTICYYPFYPTPSFKLSNPSHNPNPDIPPGIPGIILSMENNMLQILTSQGIGWVVCSVVVRM